MSQDVLLLHGLNKTPDMMREMESALTRRGYHCYNIGYASTQLSIHDCARSVAEQLQAARVGREQTPLHVVGHSLGGLIAWTLIQQLCPGLPWGRVVMLGTPIQGSELVKNLNRYRLYRRTYGKAGMEIEDYGLSLRPINKPCGVIAGTITDWLGYIGIRWIGRTGHDGRVLIEETKVKGMSDFLQFPAVHPMLPKTPGVILQTLSFLETERFCK
jgi:pimeloyl-ACP methyl ester carboxylesterase